MPTLRTCKGWSWFVVTAGLSCLAGGALASAAEAQLGRAGAHDRYFAELEPHLVVQWSREPSSCDDDGLGLGGRASFPLMDNGPIPTINNSLALGIGIDLSFFDGDCYRPIDDNYDATMLWIPVVVQWNLHFHRRFSGFIELGMAAAHEEEEFRTPAGTAHRDDTDAEVVLWLGGRYQFSSDLALTVRMGSPSFLLGLSFFI